MNPSCAQERVSVAIIGMGSVGWRQLQAAADVPQIRIAAVAEMNLRPELRQKLSIPLHADWRRLLDDPSIAAVSICLPHHLHAEAAIAALQAGKHVLLEKPIGRTLDEARRIVEVARASDKVLMIEMTHRFYPPVRAGRELVRSGRLGRIYAVEDRIIERVTMDRLPRWMFEREIAGGGVALTNGIHMLDRIAWVCGQTLRFHGGAAGRAFNLGDVEDTAVMQLSLADGVPVAFLAAWPMGVGPTDDELTIYGSNGTLRIWSWRGWRFEPIQCPAEEHAGYDASADIAARVQAGMAGALTEFASAILEQRSPGVLPEEILAAQEIIEQFYRHSS